MLAQLLAAHERDCSTSDLLGQLESLAWDLVQLDADPDGWSFAAETRAYLAHRIERLGNELARRDGLRHRPGAPPWPTTWPDARAVKQRVRLEDAIARYAPAVFEPVGAELRTCCPFPDHRDDTPSFFVNPAKQVWLCRGGCGRGGDVVSFVMMYLGLDFGAALDLLAADAGLAAAETTVARG